MYCFKHLVTEESALSGSVYPDDVTFSFTTITPFSVRDLLKHFYFIYIKKSIAQANC